jgi:probable HAF family extracellular repeat protein
MRKAILSLTDLTASRRMTLTLLAASLVGMVVLFGVGIRTAETQTTPTTSTTTYYKVQDLGTLPGATYSPPTSVPYGINNSGHVVGYAALSGYSYYDGGYPSEYVIGHAFLYKDGVMKDLGTLGGAAAAVVPLP